MINLTELDNQAESFLELVSEASGTEVIACYQCGKCSAGCPIAFTMDYQPHQVMRMVQLGLKSKVLSCSTIWLCACCYVCSTRCPRNVKVANVMEALRIMAFSEGYSTQEAGIVAFHKLFLSSVQSNGRVHELGLMLRHKLSTGDLFSDISLGRTMFSKGRLKLFADKIKGVNDVRRIFENAKKPEVHAE